MERKSFSSYLCVNSIRLLLFFEMVRYMFLMFMFIILYYEEKTDVFCMILRSRAVNKTYLYYYYYTYTYSQALIAVHVRCIYTTYKIYVFN